MFAFIAYLLVWLANGVLGLHFWNKRQTVTLYLVLFGLGTSALPLVGAFCGK